MHCAADRRRETRGGSDPVETCIALCVAKNFDFPALKAGLEDQHKCTAYRDVLHLKLKAGDVFLFSYGALVAWGLPQNDLDRVLAAVDAYRIEPFARHILDEFSFSVDGASRVKDDHISLETDEVLEKLALSHGIAQSVKLEEFEIAAQNTIEETSQIPINIAHTGETRLKRKEIAMMRGRLYLVKSDINLRNNLLETPEFFWEYPEWEKTYVMMARYLEVTQRAETLNDKLEVIHELFSMLAAEQYHKHSASLEWIIIALIAIEIVMFVSYEVFRSF
ncbi:MAG TPA: RMD1 family protein [Deltaproteobacteria bacterium]|nr:RMD1 family protein [Deltaproteobacteria bacterium]